ncbi:MAG: S8 family serine peptidase [Candidatus Binatia bacterium]|nr:S8 family serine peptidase [Candidatus Binatia bacterium]
MKLRRNMNPRPVAARAISASQQPSWLLHAGILLAAMVVWLAFAGPARGEGTTERGAPTMRRVDIVLKAAGFPAADRAASEDRIQAIAEARSSDLPLFRSFDPRDTLSETLAILADHGVDLGPTAVINFDTLEAWMPVDAKKDLAKLPFIRWIREPVAPVSAGVWDSEGIELTLADLAHAAGETGTGISVAIIDKDYEVLTDTIGDIDDELKSIAISDMFRQVGSNNTFQNADLNTHDDREHGTASAEVIYEMAPGATIKLYGVESIDGIEYSIRHAADQGFDVIHIPLTHIETMSDPTSNLAGGTNRFTDDIEYAVGLGSVVVVAAGNEAKRHLQEQFVPCLECDNAHENYICNDASDNSKFHKFEDIIEMALNPILFDDDHYDDEKITLKCWSAVEDGFPDATDFKMRLHEYDDGSENDEPICPGDDGATNVASTRRVLGGFFEKPIEIFDGEFDEHYYYLSVEDTRKGAQTAWPEFRIACGTGVDEFTFYNTPGSLSDLAVVESAITVSEIDAFFEDEVTETSSQGPAASGPLKPDIGGPGIVENFAVTEFDFVSDWTFNGTSAASAHVAAMVALMQSHRVNHGLPKLTPDTVKEWFIGTAVDIEDVGDDTKVGAGLAIVPDWVMVDAPGGLLLDQPATEFVVGDPATLTGIGFSPGSVILLYVATSAGPVSYGPFSPTTQSTTTMTWDIDPSIPLGNGFGTARVVNTDENYVQSPTQSQLLFGDPTLNIPTILTIDGTPLTAVDPTIPTANVETIIAQGSTVTITGTGFNFPLVNLFTAAGNVGPLSPEPGATANSFDIVIPPSTVTGPGSFQVVNNPYTGNVISNAVSVPIGDALDITSISQAGTTVTVNGTGFSALSVINFFAQTAGGVANLGGLDGGGASNIPLTIVSENQFTFEVPATAQAGAAYVMVLNPPFIPFSSTTGDAEGAFTLSVGP